ncbi:MAG: ImmA/IrrE family metallo-endopeptidase [Salinivirgaceae bacterium]|nr:ImmA/IrrE family metallo-endopeptidase [Salinivirgaceae bacterium]
MKYLLAFLCVLNCYTSFSQNIDTIPTHNNTNKYYETAVNYMKSEKLQIDETNMFAWSSLALHEASIQSVNTFNFDNVNQLCKELNNIFYINSNTIDNVKATLNKYGIKLILIQKLEKTPIDGFSFWSGNNPAVALTLRHTRIDNFAFTLMHEVAHIGMHLKKNKEKSFLDLTTKDLTNTYENEADSFAQEKLISNTC